MATPATGAAGAPQKRGKGLLVTGAVLVVLGLVVGIAGIVLTAGAVKSIAGTTVSAPKPAPAEFTEKFEAATTYAVYQETASAPTVTASDVTVTSEGGDPITVTATNGTVSANGANDKKYAEVATFVIGTSGTFTVKVAAKDAVVAVAPSLSVAAKGLAFGTGVILGIVLGLIGIVLLIVGAVQRSKS